MKVNCLSKLLQPSARLSLSHAGAPTQPQVGGAGSYLVRILRQNPPSFGQKIDNYCPN